MPALPVRKTWLTWQALLAIAGIAVAACGSPAPVATSSPATTPMPVSLHPPSPSAHPDNTITWPAVSATDADSFGIDISGSGNSVASVRIKDRFGAISQGGTNMAALVYLRIPWNSYSLVIYQALAVQAHMWTVFFFYCTGSVLTTVWWESTGGSTLHSEPMKGTCTPTSAFSAKVSWPAVSMAPPTPISGFQAHGPFLNIGSAVPGSALLGGRTWTLYPYATVDCWSICGSPGWYELHMLMWDVKGGAVAFAIVYLMSDQIGRAHLSYGLELPTLGRVADTWFDAPWSRTSAQTPQSGSALPLTPLA